jgi:hypothetical protein
MELHTTIGTFFIFPANTKITNLPLDSVVVVALFVIVVVALFVIVVVALFVTS